AAARAGQGSSLPAVPETWLAAGGQLQWLSQSTLRLLCSSPLDSGRSTAPLASLSADTAPPRRTALQCSPPKLTLPPGQPVLRPSVPFCHRLRPARPLYATASAPSL